jgi:Complex I intermediate-associated protein 30 (CIA30)
VPEFVAQQFPTDYTLEHNLMAWNWNQLTKTLSYFEVIPIVSNLQRMFQPTPPPPQPQISLNPQGEKILFDFRSITDLSQTWGAVDDVVMGGVSESGMMKSIDGALFTGNVSTAQSGGFVSVRTRNFQFPLDLSAYTGLEIKLKGDGSRYKFFARSSDGWDTVAYSYAFNTIANEWMTIRVPFIEMVAVLRAKTIPNAPPIDVKNIRSFQFMLSKFEYDGQLNPHFTAGHFALTLDSIRAY